MKLRKVRFEEAEPIWKTLYGSGEHLSVYMSWEFQKIYHRYFRTSANRYDLLREIYVATNEEGEIRCLLPFCRKGREYWISGDFCATGSLDLIYGEDFTLAEFDELFLAVRRDMPSGTAIHLNKINESSRFNDWLAGNLEQVRRETCVHILLPEEYDQYLKGLSKHHRHLISTARNRIEKDEKSWSVEVVRGGHLEKERYQSMMNLYNQRERERKGIGADPVTALVRNHLNPITISLKELPSSFISFLTIDGNLAGFIAGYVTGGEKSVVAPRLAIESSYSYYCPGYLLISETIRYMLENTGIRNLDLSRGDEEYKYRLGGTEHFNYTYTFTI